MGLFISLLLLNSLTFCLFAGDKLFAKLNWQRVSEKSLYIAIIIGPAGALLSMYLLRHKTSKMAFCNRAIIPFVLGFTLIIVVIYFFINSEWL